MELLLHHKPFCVSVEQECKKNHRVDAAEFFCHIEEASFDVSVLFVAKTTSNPF
jgi:hypothetical protein